MGKAMGSSRDLARHFRASDFTPLNWPRFRMGTATRTSFLSRRCQSTQKEGPGMPRQGYMIVSNGHRLFPTSKMREIEARASAVIDTITAEQPMIPRIEFQLRPIALGGRKEAKVAEALFSGGHLPELRIIFSRAVLSPKKLAPALEGSKLCVLITEVDSSAENIVRGSGGGVRASFTIAEDNAERLLEDLIIDVTLGNFFSQTGPVGAIVAGEGVSGLYKRKVTFVRQNMPGAWLDKVTRSAGYVTLSSLDRIPLADTARRAQAAYQRWFAFSQWLKEVARQN